jgi:hypothetical protein
MFEQGARCKERVVVFSKADADDATLIERVELAAA